MNLLSLLPLLLSVLGRNQPLVENAVKLAVGIIAALPRDELKAPISLIDIRVAQAKLAGLGLEPGPIDGWPGVRTQAAVKKYQAQNNLEVDGLIGQKTWASLIGDK